MNGELEYDQKDFRVKRIRPSNLDRGPIKVHKIQVGGISILEHASYKAFNECKKLQISILKHKNLFGARSHLAGDAIYATNENRKICNQRENHNEFCEKRRRKG